MAHREEDSKRRFVIDCLYYGVIFLMVWLAFNYLFSWIMPFIIAFFIAALVQPVVRVLHIRLRLNRRAAGILCVLLFMLVLLLVLSLCITTIVSELAAVAQMLPALLDQLAVSINHISQSISGYVDSLPVDYSKTVALALENMSNQLMKISTLSNGTISFVYNVLSKMPGVLLKTVITVVAACFMSMDYGDIRGFVLRQLSPKYQEWVCDIKAFFFNTISKLIRAYMILMMITFAELSVGLLIIRVPHAIVVAAVIAIVDVLPVLGTGTVMIPWALVELLLGNYYQAFCLLAIYAIIMVVRNIMEPKVVGHHLGLYPLVTLIALFVGLQIFGFAGMLLFPIIVIILKHLQDTGKIRLWKE